MMSELPNLVPVLPELFLAGTALALLMLGVFSKHEGPHEIGATRIILQLSVVALVLTLLLVTAFNGNGASTFGGMYIADGFAQFSKVLVLGASAVTLLMSRSYLEHQRIARFEYPILVLFATLGMMMMVSAGDLMSLYMGLELQSLALYVIAAFQRDSVKSTEAGLKYFVLGAIASGMLLYGASLIYGFAGTTSFAGLTEVFHKTVAAGHGVHVGVVFGIVFMIAGLAFKVSAVPFHMWTPDVYEGAPTPVTAFFALAPKIAAMALFLRLMVGPFGELIAQWQQVIVFISIASMLVGAFAAIAQTNIKRLMAYSSIGHMGYALIGLAVGTEDGVRGVLIYLAIYLFMNIGTFACILAMRRNDRMVEDISDLAGLARRSPAMALALGIFMFSLAGIPPLAGFFGKLYVFLSAIQAELYGLAIIGVLASAVGAFYYLRIVKVMYFDEPADNFDRNPGRELNVVMMVSGVVTLLFFVYPAPILAAAQAAAAALFAG